MPVNNSELISVAQTLVENENLQVTVTESFKGACMAGGGAFMGALVGGPIGMAIGGTVGSIYAAVSKSGKFKSVASVIMEDMTSHQRDELAESIRRALQDIQVQDVIMLTTLIVSNEAAKQIILREVTSFMTNQMGLSIAQ